MPLPIRDSSAAAISPPFWIDGERSLSKAIAKFTGKQPQLIERVDPSILGGLVVEVAGEKIDTSMATQLHDVEAALAQRAAQELHGGKRLFEGLEAAG